MKREEILQKIKNNTTEWDFIIIGGGATGLGTAVDAASRGYKTLLLEQHDFSKGTSSRSTKLVHGGVRYLQQGNIKLVLEALRERGLLRNNAPHLVKDMTFVVPAYDWWEGPFYGIGLKIYDKMAGDLGFGPSKRLSREETIEKIPTVETESLDGGIIYHDAQFDDSRLAITLLRTIYDHGGTALNYAKVTGLLKKDSIIRGVTARDEETGDTLELKGRAVVNATGVFTDQIRQMDDPRRKPIIQASQGVHIVLDKKFLPGESAIMVPRTDDGRVLFAVPWQDRIIVGTTDTPVEEIALEPRALEEELEFLLTHAARYLVNDPKPSDVLSVFAGLRPLVSPDRDSETSSISRDHSLIIDPSGLVTITGGKWTTYRKMAEDTVDEAAIIGNLERRECVTEHLRLHGYDEDIKETDPFALYGSDSALLHNMIRENPGLDEWLHPELPYKKAEVLWAVRHEMARTLEDVLARRTRALLLNARASIKIAKEVATLMAKELGRDKNWIHQQTTNYHNLANQYLINNNC